MEVKIKQSKRSKIGSFLKRNVYFIVCGVCVLAIAGIIILANVGGKNEPAAPTNGNTNTPSATSPVSETTISYVLPLNEFTILKDYSDTSLMYNSTLKQWEAHKAIDFSAAEGTKVLSVANGTVEQVYTNYMNGNVVVINHGNGVKSLYSSLADDSITVSVGQSVKAGDVLGEVGATASKEFTSENHLHLEMYCNDALCDPNGYLSLTEK